MEELRDEPRYRQVLELDFSEMIPFVLEQIRRRSPVSFSFLVLNLVLLAGIIGYIVQILSAEQLTLGKVIVWSLYGMAAGSLAVVPVHEGIHGLAYKLLGAGRVHFGADLQQMIFFVTSDRYPVSGKELSFLALAPFVMINLATVGIVLWLSPEIFLFPAFFLFTHNLMCIGDFAVVNYVYLHPRRVYSFDEVEQKRSYFFEEQPGGVKESGEGRESGEGQG